jgi:hypothetical protein
MDGHYFQQITKSIRNHVVNFGAVNTDNYCVWEVQLGIIGNVNFVHIDDPEYFRGCSEGNLFG